MANGKKQRGMTLLEVMVALVIFSTAAMALMNSVSLNVHFTHSLGDTLEATWVAQNQLAEAALEKRAFADVAQEGREQMGGREWRWRAQRVDMGKQGFANEIAVFAEDQPEQPIVNLQILAPGGRDEQKQR
jgi:general secretion pathway protein I